MACPICKRETVHKYRPFCSARCADVDLGKWLTGAYAIPADDPDDSDGADRAPDTPHQSSVAMIPRRVSMPSPLSDDVSTISG